MNTIRQARCRAAQVMAMPPMWVYGKGMLTTSVESSPMRTVPLAEAMTEASVCLQPFGSAVVPIVDRRSGRRRMGFAFRALLGVVRGGGVHLFAGRVEGDDVAVVAMIATACPLT